MAIKVKATIGDYSMEASSDVPGYDVGTATALIGDVVDGVVQLFKATAE